MMMHKKEFVPKGVDNRAPEYRAYFEPPREQRPGDSYATTILVHYKNPRSQI